ncbi:MAG: DUF349 domain-containing protein, partial [Rhodoluna sp.]|nr:DUF349 domain-containing protein [Rhodoluna sp.]
SFGRVDADNNVFVTDSGVERKVGQYTAGDAEKALAFYTTRFADLEAQVRILEQRVKSGVDAKNLKKAFDAINAELVEPNVVGDIQSLRNRVLAVAPKIEEHAAAKAEENKEAIAEAVKLREELVAKAEALAAADPAKTIWKIATAELTALFEAWQQSQKTGPRLPKAEADALWKRFSAARTKVEAAKRAFFASSDAAAKAAKATKLALVEKAEALTSKGADAVADYRKLLDAWKTAGRSNSKADDALWARFKAAGDAIYAAKGEQVAVASASQAEAFAAKVALLEEIKAIDPESDFAAAKKLLASIQDRWEKAGRVSRDQISQTEDKLKAIEARVRKAEAEHWKANDPAAKARKDDVTIKLEEAIAKLEAE